MDGFDFIDIFGHEPDAIVWYRVIRQLRSGILAAYDDGEQQRNTDGTGYYANHLLRNDLPTSGWHTLDRCQPRLEIGSRTVPNRSEALCRHFVNGSSYSLCVHWPLRSTIRSWRWCCLPPHPSIGCCWLDCYPP